MSRLITQPPSFNQGFAQSAGESACPELWKGLEALWIPPLGNTGSSLYDISGNGRHMDLVNVDGTNWTAGSEQIDIDGSTEYGTVTTAQNPLAGLSAATFIVSLASTDTASGLPRVVSCGLQDDLEFAVNLSGGDAAGIPTGRMGMFIRNTGGWYDIGPIVSGETFTVAFTGSAKGLAAYTNGVQSFSDGTAWSNGTDGVLNFFARYQGGSKLAGQLGSCSVYSRVLAQSEIRQLANDPVAPCRLHRRTAYSVPAAPGGFQPAWAANSNAVISGGQTL